jgi:enamine deaminase RidA (YjgF/YER057c/UK114 family)
VHHDLFAEVAPANTTVFVSGFPPEGVLVEVEVDAILPG